MMAVWVCQQRRRAPPLGNVAGPVSLARGFNRGRLILTAKHMLRVVAALCWTIPGHEQCRDLESLTAVSVQMCKQLLYG